MKDIDLNNLIEKKGIKDNEIYFFSQGNVLCSEVYSSDNENIDDYSFQFLQGDGKRDTFKSLSIINRNVEDDERNDSVSWFPGKIQNTSIEQFKETLIQEKEKLSIFNSNFDKKIEDIQRILETQEENISELNFKNHFNIDSPCNLITKSAVSAMKAIETYLASLACFQQEQVDVELYKNKILLYLISE